MVENDQGRPGGNQAASKMIEQHRPAPTVTQGLDKTRIRWTDVIATARTILLETSAVFYKPLSRLLRNSYLAGIAPFWNEDVVTASVVARLAARIEYVPLISCSRCGRKLILGVEGRRRAAEDLVANGWTAVDEAVYCPDCTHDSGSGR